MAFDIVPGELLTAHRTADKHAGSLSSIRDGGLDPPGPAPDDLGDAGLSRSGHDGLGATFFALAPASGRIVVTTSPVRGPVRCTLPSGGRCEAVFDHAGLLVSGSTSAPLGQRRQSPASGFADAAACPERQNARPVRVGR